MKAFRFAGNWYVINKLNKTTRDSKPRFPVATNNE